MNPPKIQHSQYTIIYHNGDYFIFWGGLILGGGDYMALGLTCWLLGGDREERGDYNGVSGSGWLVGNENIEETMATST